MAIITKSSNFRSSSVAKKSPKHLIEYLLKENDNGIRLSSNVAEYKDEIVSHLQDHVKDYNRNSVQHYIIAFYNVGQIDDQKMTSIGLRAMQMLNYTPDDSNYLLTLHTDGRSPHIHFIVYTWQVDHTLTNAAITPRRIPNNEFTVYYKKNKKKLEKQQYDISRALEVEFGLPSDSVGMRSCKEYWMESRLRIKDRMRESISEAISKATNGEEFVEYLETASRQIFSEFMTMLEQEGRYRILSKVVGPPELKFYQNKKDELVFVMNNFSCGDRKLGVDYSLEAINKSLNKNFAMHDELLVEGLIENSLETKKKDDVVNQGLRFSIFDLEPVHQLTLTLTQNYESRIEPLKEDLTPLIRKLDREEEKLKQDREEVIRLQQWLIETFLEAQRLLEEEEEEMRKRLFNLEYEDLLKKIKEEELKMKNYYEKMDNEKLVSLEKYLKELEINISRVKSDKQNIEKYRISEKVEEKTYKRIDLETTCSLAKSMMIYLERKMIDNGDQKGKKYYSPEKVVKSLGVIHSKKSIGELLDSIVKIDPSNSHQPKNDCVVEEFKRQEISKNREMYLDSIKDSFEFKMLVGIIRIMKPSLEFASSRNFKIDSNDLNRNDSLLLRSLSGLTSFSNNIISTDNTMNPPTQIKIKEGLYIDPQILVNNPFPQNQNIRIRYQSLLFMYTADLLRKMNKNEILKNTMAKNTDLKKEVKNLANQFKMIGVLMLSYAPKETLQGLGKQNEIVQNSMDHIRQISKGNGHMNR